MHRTRLVAGLLVALVGTLLLGCTATSTVSSGTGAGTAGPVPTTAERIDDTGVSSDVPSKKVFKRDQPDIAVLVGEKFAIRLPEDPAAGEEWKVLSAPDGRVVKADGDSFKAEAPAAGAAAPSAGQHEFKYKARAAGTTTITLNLCRNCPAGSNGVKDMAEPERVTFTITVS